MGHVWTVAWLYPLFFYKHNPWAHHYLCILQARMLDKEESLVSHNLKQPGEWKQEKREGERMRGREGGRMGGRQAGREGGDERWREGTDDEREGGREGKERERRRNREGMITYNTGIPHCICVLSTFYSNS